MSPAGGEQDDEGPSSSFGAWRQRLFRSIRPGTPGTDEDAGTSGFRWAWWRARRAGPAIDTRTGPRPVKESRDRVDIFQKCYDWKRVKEAQASGLYPYFIPITGEQGAEVTIHGQRLIMLGSNNYLGLTNDPRVKEAAREAILKYGVGCTGSRFLNGTLDLHLDLERELADWMGKPSALVFSTGYQANLGSIFALVGREDIVLTDRRNHASIFDGCRQAYGKTVKFNHNDLDDLERVLGTLPPRPGKLLVIDGVYSMEGTLPDLTRAISLVRKHGARILVDEAHGVGVLGPGGRGACDEQGVIEQVDLVMGTFSKSFASIGGFVAGEEDVVTWIKHRARSMIFSAALPPPALATALKCLEVIRREPERRQRLSDNARRLREGLRGMGYTVGESHTPIIPVIVGEDQRCFVLWRALFEHGVFTNPVVSPATPPGHALLRVSCMATHEPSTLDRALEIFRDVGRKTSVLA